MNNVTPLAKTRLDLDIPSVRQITLELVHLLNDTSTDVDDIVTTIKLDPVLTARIIAYANSPLMAPLRAVTDLGTAVIRSGVNELKKIFYRTVIRDAFASVEEETETIMQLIWMHSLTASLAMEKLRIATQDYIRLDDEEYASLSTLGILHNIGFLVLHHNFRDEFLDLFLNNPPLSMDEFFAAERNAFGGWDHREAGKHLLDSWYFPRFLGETLEAYCETGITYQDSHLVILLRLSNYLASQACFSIYPCNPPDFWLTNLPKEIDLEAIHALLPALAQEVALHQSILES